MPGPVAAVDGQHRGSPEDPAGVRPRMDPAGPGPCGGPNRVRTGVTGCPCCRRGIPGLPDGSQAWPRASRDTGARGRTHAVAGSPAGTSRSHAGPATANRNRGHSPVRPLPQPP